MEASAFPEPKVKSRLAKIYGDDRVQVAAQACSVLALGVLIGMAYVPPSCNHKPQSLDAVNARLEALEAEAKPLPIYTTQREQRESEVR